MKRQNIINIHGVQFHKITQRTFQKINLSNLRFFIISRSGAIDTPGNIYFFTTTDAFFMNNGEYKNNFINNFLSIIQKENWHKINLYFCDDLIINPEIYDSFLKKLCANNIRDFWFQTAIDIFKNRV